MSQKLALFALAVFAVMSQPLCAHAESTMYSQANEWKGIKKVLSVMGKGRLTQADKTSIFEILDTKSQVEESKPNIPTAFPSTPIAPNSTKTLPPYHPPSSL